MQHRVVLIDIDLSSPDEPSFAIGEVSTDDKDQIVHYPLKGACITSASTTFGKRSNRLIS